MKQQKRSCTYFVYTFFILKAQIEIAYVFWHALYCCIRPCVDKTVFNLVYSENVPPVNAQIRKMVVLRNTKGGVEEHRVQAYNEVVKAISRSVRVQPFISRTIAHHTHGPSGSTQQYGEMTIRCPPRPSSGCRNEERNTHARLDQPVVVGKNDGISWIDDYVICPHHGCRNELLDPVRHVTSLR